MATARPLREVFTDLVGQDAVGGDTAEVLRANGHPDLPGELVAEAVVNFADTAPIEVSEHLAPFVAANSAVPQIDGPDPGELSWLEALTSAPVPDSMDPAAGLDFTRLDDPAASSDTSDTGPAHLAHPHAPLADGPAHALDFGHGDLDDAARVDPAHDRAGELDDAHVPDGHVPPSEDTHTVLDAGQDTTGPDTGHDIADSGIADHHATPDGTDQGDTPGHDHGADIDLDL